MQQIYGRREGNIVTVFLEGDERPAAWPEPRSFENPPIGFPLTLTVAQASVKYPGIKFIEQKREPLVVGKVIDDARIAEVAPTPPPAIVNRSPAPNSSHSVFADMLARYRYLRGKEAKQMKSDIEAVATFMLEAGLATEEELRSMKESALAEKKRFAL